MINRYIFHNPILSPACPQVIISCGARGVALYGSEGVESPATQRFGMGARWITWQVRFFFACCFIFMDH